MGMTYPSNKVCPRCGTGGYVWYLDNSEYVAKCTNCGHYFRREDFPMCVLDRVKKPMTNADRIRAMTDEELAEFFGRQKYRRPTFDGWLPLCYYVMGPRMCHEDGCKKCWLDWLRQEVEEGE